MKFALAHDSSSACYLIPAHRREDWERWVAKTEGEDGENLPTPDYALPVDGPISDVSFERPEIRGDPVEDRDHPINWGDGTPPGLEYQVPH